MTVSQALGMLRPSTHWKLVSRMTGRELGNSLSSSRASMKWADYPLYCDQFGADILVQRGKYYRECLSAVPCVLLHVDDKEERND